MADSSILTVSLAHVVDWLCYTWNMITLRVFTVQTTLNKPIFRHIFISYPTCEHLYIYQMRWFFIRANAIDLRLIIDFNYMQMKSSSACNSYICAYALLTRTLPLVLLLFFYTFGFAMSIWFSCQFVISCKNLGDFQIPI